MWQADFLFWWVMMLKCCLKICGNFFCLSNCHKMWISIFFRIICESIFLWQNRVGSLLVAAAEWGCNGGGVQGVLMLKYCLKICDFCGWWYFVPKHFCDKIYEVLFWWLLLSEVAMVVRSWGSHDVEILPQNMWYFVTQILSQNIRVPIFVTKYIYMSFYFGDCCWVRLQWWWGVEGVMMLNQLHDSWPCKRMMMSKIVWDISNGKKKHFIIEPLPNKTLCSALYL